MGKELGIDDIGISDEDIPAFLGTTDEDRANTNLHEHSNYNEASNNDDDYVQIEDDNNEPELEEQLARAMNEKAKAVIDEQDEDEDADENEEAYRYLSKKFNIDEELIIMAEEKYKSISRGYEDIKAENVSKKDVEIWAREAKENKVRTTNEKIAMTIVSSIMKDISSSNKLEVIKSDSLYIQKEQSAFFLSVLDKINHWQEKINNAPEDIINNEYVKHLFSAKEDYKLKVFKPNIMIYEENFSGKNGFNNFVNVAKQLVTEDQAKELEKIKEFVLSNNMENIMLEKIFKL